MRRSLDWAVGDPDDGEPDILDGEYPEWWFCFGYGDGTLVQKALLPNGGDYTNPPIFGGERGGSARAAGDSGWSTSFGCCAEHRADVHRP